MRNNRVRLRAVVLTALALLLVSSAAAEEEEWTVRWDNGFRVESADWTYQLKFGGRLQADWTITAPDRELELALGESISDGNEFRRARLFFEGLLYERVEFKVEYDFAGGDADFKDAYAGIRDTRAGDIRFGHLKEPFGLEQLTSSKYMTFLERSLTDVFAPGRNTGLTFFDHVGDRFTWAAGAFREADGFGTTRDGEGQLHLTARVTGLPWYEEDGRRLVHLGLSLSHKDLGRQPFGLGAPPEVHQAPDFADTGDFLTESVRLYAVEFAVVVQRFWAMAEFHQADVDEAFVVVKSGTILSACADPLCTAGASLGKPAFRGATAQAGLFLTDDVRPYKTSSGTFDRVKPARNFGDGGGAWEIAVRYSMLDLSDAGILGGGVENLTLGVNWYLNPATRLMMDWVHSERDDLVDPGTGDRWSAGADFLTVRFQVDF